MTVVIAGCGDLGTEVGLRFVDLGHRVIGLRRSAAKLPPELEGQSVDLSSDEPSLPADTRFLVIAMAPDERSVAGYRAAYVDSVRHTLAAVARDCTEAPRVMFVSSTAVHGVNDGSWVDETTPTDPATPTARVLAEAEEMLSTLAPGATILRLGGIYGPGRTREIDRLRDGSSSVSPKPRFTNRIHRDDAAAAIIHLLTMEARPASVYVGVDDCPVQYREVVQFLAARLGVPCPVPDADPDGPLAAVGKRCRNTRLRDSGFTFTYPTFREGYAAVLAGIGTRHA